MRRWVVATLVVMACNGDPPAIRSQPLVAPKVEVATVLAGNPTPPFLVVVDDQGNAYLGAAATWADLDAGRMKRSRGTPLAPLVRFIRAEIALGKASVASVSRWDNAPQLPALDEVPEDDPPPPEEEEEEEEPGGTYLHVTPEEGTLGKKDSDRPEGQYKMLKLDTDPQIARQRAIEAARSAGILSAPATAAAGWYTAEGPPALRPDGRPSRNAEVTGIVESLPFDMRAMVLVSPTSPAYELVEILGDTQYAIAVMHAGRLRPLRLRFGVDGWSADLDWLEVRVSPRAIVVEAVADKALEVAEPAGIAAALADARASRDIDEDAQVDVLVDPSLDAQRLVDVLVALDTAGVHAVGLGPMPSSEQLERRGRRIATVTLGPLNAAGDLEKPLIRRTVKQSAPKLRRCYEDALRGRNPTLGGTVQTQFFISPDGQVLAANATGVHWFLSDCVAAVIKALEFPKPTGGGGTQVNYSLFFRQ